MAENCTDLMEHQNKQWLGPETIEIAIAMINPDTTFRKMMKSKKPIKDLLRS
jgi:hypothetical protein